MHCDLEAKILMDSRATTDLIFSGSFYNLSLIESSSFIVCVIVGNSTSCKKMCHYCLAAFEKDTR